MIIIKIVKFIMILKASSLSSSVSNFCIARVKCARHQPMVDIIIDLFVTIAAVLFFPFQMVLYNFFDLVLLRGILSGVLFRWVLAILRCRGFLHLESSQHIPVFLIQLL